MLARPTPQSPLARLRDEMDMLFERFFGGEDVFEAWEPFAARRSLPAVNVWQDEDKVYVEAELPGVPQKDIDLSVAGNELTIKGQRRGLEPKQGTTVLRRERGAGQFARVVRLPADVDETKVDATARNGVLLVTLSKSEVARPRRIPVKALGA